MSILKEQVLLETRRQFLQKTAAGIGSIAFGTLLGSDREVCAAGLGTSHRGALGAPHHAPRAKRIIFLFMAGAPSQMDLLDFKPKMHSWYGKDLPDEVRGDQRLTGMTAYQERFPIAPSIYKFSPAGESGTYISELLPYTSQIVDDIAIVKSVWTEAINHDPAITYIQTGSQQPGGPSAGAWVSYGLGSINKNLPSFVVMNSSWTGRQAAQALFSRLWGAGFLPSDHQGVIFRSIGDPILYLTNPDGLDAEVRRAMLDGVTELNQAHYNEAGDPETLARIAQYEMAARMQTSVPELTDFSNETESTFALYGPDVRKAGTFAYNCLMARRLAERDVPFVQIFHRGWDHHDNLPKDLSNQCKDVDQACYGLITDLKQRGLLDDTLVIWGGEFGRTIYCQGTLTPENYGRDHHPRCFSVWLAGAGIKGGTVYGETDDFCYNIVKGPVHIRDLQATMLHQLGIDHSKFSFKFRGLDQRLTGVEEAQVVHGILR